MCPATCGLSTVCRREGAIAAGNAHSGASGSQFGSGSNGRSPISGCPYDKALTRSIVQAAEAVSVLHHLSVMAHDSSCPWKVGLP